MADPSSVQSGSMLKQSVYFSSQHSASGLIKKASGTNSSNSEFHREENASKTLTKNIEVKKVSIFNDSLDEDFQCSQLKNRINNAIKAKKKQEDNSFLCAVCSKDLTAANIDERAAHMNQCIDNQNLVDATCEASSSSVFILDCPLCFKSFPSPELRSAHIKKCGKSRGLSIQSIVQAVQLQEKHTLERRAMGLPLHRTNQLRQSKNNQGQSKKNPSRRLPVAPKSSLQSDIQLAKALSLSLKENESQSQQNFIQEVYPSLQPPSESQNPGRATTKRKQLNQLYPLLLRTEEEREKIIQDKINALVIRMDQSNKKESKSPNEDSENEKVPFLWNLCGKAEDKSSYYVEQLLDWIMPSDVQIGSKLCNLSQIPGHRIFTQLPCDYTFNLDKTVDEEDKMPNSQLPSLLNSLQSLIGNSWMSDVDINTASGIVIPAHKLILALRCSSLKDAFDDPPSSGRHILNWQDTSFDAALHFLNFLYTGTTEWKDDIFEELFQLAKKYEVKDLLFILNSNREMAELISDEDSAPDVSNVSSKDCLSKEGESKRESTEQESCLEEGDLDHSDPCVKDKESYTAITNTSGVKIHENSSIFDKSIKSIVHTCEEESDNLSSGVKGYIEQDLFEGKDKDSENQENRNFNSLHEGNKVDLDATLPLNVESESSNDSCKILHECASQTPNKNEQSNFMSSNPYDIDSFPGCGTPFKTKFATPTKNLSRNNTPDKSNLLSPFNSFKFSDVSMKSPQTPKRKEQSNYISSETFDNKRFLGSDTPTKTAFATPTKILSEGSTPEKLNNLSVPIVIETLENDLNEDIVVIGGFRKSNENSSPAVQNRSSSSKDSPYNRMSYDFLDSPFHIDDDFNCGFGLSQNGALHLNTSQERESSSFVSRSYKNSSSPCKTLNELDKTQKSGEIIESVSREVSTNKDTEKVASSPEIFICDSDGESDLVLNENSFRKYRETKEDPLNCSPITFSDSFSVSSKSVCMSLDDGHRESEDKNEPPNPPEVICCNSSSSEEELSKRILSLKAFKSPSKEVFNSLKQAVDDGCRSSNIKPDVPSENLESPDSPWVFRVYKPPRKVKESTSTCTAPEDVPSKKKIKNSTSKGQNKSKGMLPATPSTAALKFQISNSPITPLPDFKTMHTPEIKEALKKVGVRALPRKKAVAVLSHIYDETHPLNGAEGGPDKDADPSPSDKTSKVLNVPTKRKQPAEKNVKAAKKKQKANTLSQAMGDEDVFENQETKKETKKSKFGSSRPPKSSSSSQDSKNMVQNLGGSPKESCNYREEYEGNLSFMSDGSDSGKLESKEDPESITEYIQSNDDLYRRVLNYVPLNLGDFHQELKENGIKISVKNLMDYLDEQCITFTCPRKEEYKKKQALRSQRFRKRMIAKLSQQQGPSNPS